MVENRCLSRGVFVRRHERAARQLTDNVWGKSMTTCHLADLEALAEDARS